jgi:hypothetical protein
MSSHLAPPVHCASKQTRLLLTVSLRPGGPVVVVSQLSDPKVAPMLYGGGDGGFNQFYLPDILGVPSSAV